MSKIYNMYMWVVVKIRVPFWVRAQKGTLILTTTHILSSVLQFGSPGTGILKLYGQCSSASSQ